MEYTPFLMAIIIAGLETIFPAPRIATQYLLVEYQKPILPLEWSGL